jgi:hypothetical protein
VRNTQLVRELLTFVAIVAVVYLVTSWISPSPQECDSEGPGGVVRYIARIC